MAMSFSLMLTLLIVGMLSFVVLFFILFIFGRLIWLQTRLWLLAKKGFVQVRHIREDKVEKYYYLRVKDNSFRFDDGIFISEKEATTKTSSLLNRFDYHLLSKKPIVELKTEEREVLKFLDGIKNSKVMDVTTLSWGIPTVTYFGANPNPINYAEIKKLHDAKNIAAMIKRIIMTKEWKLVRMVLLLCTIALFLWVVLGFLDYGIAKGNTQNLNTCLQQLNVSETRWQVLANESEMYRLKASLQNSTVII